MGSFTNLRPGNYTVTEDQQAGWEQSVPGSEYYNIYLSDKSAYGYNFGNFRLPSASDKNIVNATDVPVTTDISYDCTFMHVTPEFLKQDREFQESLPETYIQPETGAKLTTAPTEKYFDLLNYLPDTKGFSRRAS